MLLLANLLIKVSAKGLSRRSLTFKKLKEKALLGVSKRSSKIQKQRIKKQTRQDRKNKGGKPKQSRRKRPPKPAPAPNFKRIRNIKYQSMLGKLLVKILTENFRHVFSKESVLTIYQVFKAEKLIANNQILRVIVRSKSRALGTVRFFGVELSFLDHRKTENWFDFLILKFGFTPSLERCYDFLGLETFLHGFEQLVPYMNRFRELDRRTGKATRVTFNVKLKSLMMEFLVLVRRLVGFDDAPREDSQTQKRRKEKMMRLSKSGGGGQRPNRATNGVKSKPRRRSKDGQIRSTGSRRSDGKGANTKVSRPRTGRNGRQGVQKRSQKHSKKQRRPQGGKNPTDPYKKGPEILIGNSTSTPDYIF